MNWSEIIFATSISAIKLCKFSFPQLKFWFGLRNDCQKPTLLPIFSENANVIVLKFLTTIVKKYVYTYISDSFFYAKLLQISNNKLFFSSKLVNVEDVKLHQNLELTAARSGHDYCTTFYLVPHKTKCLGTSDLRYKNEQCKCVKNILLRFELVRAECVDKSDLF